MHQTLQIRPTTVNDAQGIHPLLHQLGYQLSPDTLISKLSTRAEGRFAFVAELESRIVGFMTLHVIDWFHRADAAARLSALVVDAAYRRLGIGRELVDFAEAEACRLGCSYVELTSSVRRKVDGTYDFYASLGYEAVQHQTTYFRKAVSNLSP